MKAYLCRCDAEFSNKAAFIRHYRRQHPEEADGCYDQCGSTGDAFADKMIEQMRSNNHERVKEYDKLKAKAELYDKLLVRFNALVAACQIGRSAMEQYVNAHEPKASSHD